MIGPSQIGQSDGYTIGICATGAPAGLGRLLETAFSEDELAPLKLRRVIVVASGCSDAVVSELEGIRRRNARLHLIVEKSRLGKADAINKILTSAEGRLIAMVNSDATPQRGAIPRLVSEAALDPSVGAISAIPSTEDRGGLTSLLLDFMWSAHNESSMALNHLGISNHSCDELVVFRSSAMSFLPQGLVNDGAFLAATVRKRGYSVKVSPTAKVLIETPTRISDIIRQRRRILFGHVQVWRKLGNPPRTIESLLLFTPLLGLRLLMRTIARQPRFVLALPLALVSELSALMLSIQDSIRSTKMHAVWRRFN
jgi:cellulose synthase/poly-beta-1,6-N-acetylglucosamine synthase-like glycosyltransferase